MYICCMAVYYSTAPIYRSNHVLTLHQAQSQSRLPRLPQMTGVTDTDHRTRNWAAHVTPITSETPMVFVRQPKARPPWGPWGSCVLVQTLRPDLGA